jgi:NADPH:quinone reductase-like Zn-dependent oxidoreductase
MVRDRVMAATPFAFAQFAPVDYRHLVPVLEPTSWTDGAGADVVLDHVGGAPFGALLAATRPRGTIINIGRLAGRTATVDLDLLAFRRLRVLGTTFSIRSDEERGEVAAAVKAEVVPAVAAGRIRPVVDRVIPFADAPKAAELMRANAVTGKIVLDLAGVE